MMWREGEGVWLIKLDVLVKMASCSTSRNFLMKCLHTPILDHWYQVLFVYEVLNGHCDCSF